MFPVDVHSLFTSVPLSETVDYLCEALSTRNLSLPTTVPQTNVVILFCPDNKCSDFQEKSSNQIDGVLMDSLLGHTIANIIHYWDDWKTKAWSYR